MNSADDYFKIYDSGKGDKEDSFVILKGLVDDYKKMDKRAQKKAEREKKKKKQINFEKKKLRKIVELDLVLEYRQILSYMSKASGMGPIKQKKDRQRLYRLAAYSMEYSTFLQEMLVKLGEKEGKLDFPYAIEEKEVPDLVKSHIYIEKKILAMYRSIRKEYQLDEWLRVALNYTIDMKARNLEKIRSESRGIFKKPGKRIKR